MSDNQVIPDAAVEAAVRASYRRNDWGDEYNRKFIQRALEAAAPHLMARPDPEADLERATENYRRWLDEEAAK
jgi:hypothetical protein